MTYKSREDKKSKKKQTAKLLSLYFDSKTFNEFKLRALQECNYKHKLLDPFWMAYCYVSHPYLYWLCMHLAWMSAAGCICSLMIALTGNCLFAILFPLIWIIGLLVFTFSYGYDIVSKIAEKEGIISYYGLYY